MDEDPDESRSGDVTTYLLAISAGDHEAADQLLPLVYDELRRLAIARMEGLPPGQTLQPTALVHEAYLRLLGSGREGLEGTSFENRAHFFGACAEAMRRILVERARRRRRLRHGGAHGREELHEDKLVELPENVDLLALDEALARLEEEDAEKAQLVKLRFFAGLSIVEAAEVLEISRATADRRWAFARAWLYREVSKGDPEPAPEDGPTD